MKQPHKYTNQLIHSLSPYLLQHAHNPVHWYEWNETAWEKAKTEDKPVLVSIGYSSCHWCHVMEHESFENEDTAAIMNEYFVCIKVDREERPDIDQIYMDAVQLISGHGGWPLNMFTLPDGRPIHGGTYFPNLNWNQLLFQIADLYKNKKQEAIEYAENLTKGIREMDLIKVQKSDKMQKEELDVIYETWAKSFDYKEGGNARTPKFPLPNNFLYLFNYGLLAESKEALDFVEFTLRKMAQGGIYDQLGGGFARYSVDSYWLVPHFEKMLYDNGQLLSLYARMYALRPNELLLKTITQTIHFLKTELSNGEGGFYSSYDADSEGMEGKYYVWKWDELTELLGPKSGNVLEYYQCTLEGNWEHGWNILHCKHTPAEFAKLKGMDVNGFENELNNAGKILLEARSHRIKPGLDDKIILSWNALALEGLCHSYSALNDKSILDLAITNANFILNKMKTDDALYRIYKEGNVAIPAFLEDYASFCSALIELYKVTFEEKYLLEARSLAETVISEFYDEESGLFYFTSNKHESLVAKKKDLGDDVISSGNSIMIRNLRSLYFYFGEENYRSISEKMAANIRSQFAKYPSWYSNWGRYFLEESYGTLQLSVTGKEYKSVLNADELKQFPDLIIAGAEKESQLNILQDRFSDKTTFFVCKDETCYNPASRLEEAELLMKKCLN